MLGEFNIFEGFSLVFFFLFLCEVEQCDGLTDDINNTFIISIYLPSMLISIRITVKIHFSKQYWTEFISFNEADASNNERYCTLHVYISPFYSKLSYKVKNLSLKRTCNQVSYKWSACSGST